MNPLNRKLSRRASIQTLVVFGIGLITLVLWMTPALTGNGSPWDALVCAIWALCLICLLTLNYRRALRKEAQARTVYLDRTNRKLYSQNIGIVAYRNGCQLTEIMGSSFAKGATDSHHEMPNPSEFQLSAIIRSTSFDFQMNIPDPTFAFKNMTISDWRGVVEIVDSGRTASFESLGELEDLLCPLANVDAVSIVGQCPDAGTEACLINERMIRSTHGSEPPLKLPASN